ncbi:MAG TPA: AAA family ATPase [Gemmataceae bacterium]|nr:AAA family ATPase [Gemmataceae bacterium]
MAKLRIARDVLARARDRSNLTGDEKITVEQLLRQGTGKGPVTANVHDCPLAFLKALLDDPRLSPNQRAVVVLQVHGMGGGKDDRDFIYNTPVANPVEFGSVFMTLGSKAPNCELFLNGRWYPVTMHVQFPGDKDDYLAKGVLLQGCLSLCEFSYAVSHYVYPDLFLDDAGQRRDRTVLEVLNHFGFRRLQTPASEFNLKLVRAERAAREHGRVVLVSGPVLMHSALYWWSRLESRALGTPELPRKAVVEPELEVSEENRSYHAPFGQNQQAVSRLPFVRVFSFDTKGYVYVDADDVTAYEFDSSAMAKLHLPVGMLSVLSRVFNTPVEELFGDLIKGKHGGVVILACGNPGVGKTLTAEVYAEQTCRPLYVLELGELGTNVAQVEENLNRVFTRVARWNAVLQFDECEIFLAKRGEDLERSAIVGSFLRLLDYYRGILFLTTNRWQVLDHAVLSRVMLKLDYPDLDQAARTVIWRTMLEAAGLVLAAGAVEELAQAVVNGRQIRNLTRLAKILYPTGQVTLEQMRAVLGYGCA